MTKLLIVCSPGGHLTTARKLIKGLDIKYKYVIHSSKSNQIEGVEVLHAPHSDRDWRIFKQLIYAFKVVRREKPIVILSTGGGIAVSFFLAGKIYGSKLIFVESLSRVHSLSLTGNLVKPIVDLLYVRYKKLAVNNKIRYIGD